MNFAAVELSVGRQRSRQWDPLKTQQSRLRHVTQIQIFNVPGQRTDKYYFTLHLTNMSAPFYTSEAVPGPNLRYSDLKSRNVPNSAASAIVLRVWRKIPESQDKTILTWGINLSGLLNLGNKTAEVLPYYFKDHSVIVQMHGGYFTSQFSLRQDLLKPAPFKDTMNLIGEPGQGKVYRCASVKSPKGEVATTYTLEKLRKLQSLQLALKAKELDVQLIKDKIDKRNGLVKPSTDSSSGHFDANKQGVRYEPQLLTMNHLNKMLQERPSASQMQEMAKLKREIEEMRLKTRLLAHEKVQKLAALRVLKEKCAQKVEDNDVRNSELMENYRALSRENERQRETKRNLIHQQEHYRQLSLHVQHRRRQLMRQLLSIYPIEHQDEDKYLINGIYLPNSDVLADCSDVGLSVALGYVTHLLIMCSTFLQVPLRYPMVHMGSRSTITDSVSPYLNDRERLFPLFTRGKEKMQFTYAVYLLNKNLAQLRWLFFMQTPNLKATLPNLLNFLHGPRVEPSIPALSADFLANSQIAHSQNAYSLPSNSSTVEDLDSILRKTGKLPKGYPIGCRSVNKCTKEFSIPEAFLNKQISRDSFKSMLRDGYGHVPCCGSSSGSSTNLAPQEPLLNQNDSIEEGTDPLAQNAHLNLPESIKVHNEQLKDTCSKLTQQEKRLSRSAGSYTDEEPTGLQGLHYRNTFEVGSEPLLNEPYLQQWLKDGRSVQASSDECVYHRDGIEIPQKPLTARTDALLNTKSFNLVRPK